MNCIGIIPARYKSTRFPGKPIADIEGKPMIWHVYNSAIKWGGFSELLVATDDRRIQSACLEYNLPCVMTHPYHKDCIDRAAEVAMHDRYERFDRYIIIQGDEPFFDYRTLDADYSPSVVNFYTKVADKLELEDPNVVKVVVSKSLRAIYFSRHSIPYHHGVTMKSDDPVNIDKQIGVYSLSREALKQFSVLGMSYLEGIEGIGMLRFLENDIDVHMRYSEYDSLSVDTPEDLERVKKIMLKGS